MGKKTNWADKSYNNLKNINPLSPEAAGVGRSNWRDLFTEKDVKEIEAERKASKKKK